MDSGWLSNKLLVFEVPNIYTSTTLTTSTSSQAISFSNITLCFLSNHVRYGSSLVGFNGSIVLKAGKKKTDLSAHFPATEHKVYQVKSVTAAHIPQLCCWKNKSTISFRTAGRWKHRTVVNQMRVGTQNQNILGVKSNEDQ